MRVCEDMDDMDDMRLLDGDGKVLFFVISLGIVSLEWDYSLSRL